MSVITTASPYELLPQQELVQLVMMLMETNQKLEESNKNLQKMIVALQESNKNFEESNKTLVFEVEKLKYELAHYKQLVHGPKPERFIGSTSPEQLALDLNVEPTHIVEVEQVQKIEAHERVKIKKLRNYKTTGRQALPAHLPRERVVIQPPIDLTGYKQIGEEITEELNYKEGEFSVTQIVRPKYAEIEIAKRDGEQPATAAQEEEEKTNIVIADLPERLIPRCMASDSLLAHIIVSKYVDHLPLDRQLKMYERNGIELSNSTAGGWVSQVATALVPLGEALRRLIFSSLYLMADETTLKVQDRKKKGKTHQGYLWAYLDPINKLVVFDYQPGRGREGPLDCLQNFKGHLQTDAYNAYEIFADREGVTLLHCMAHARRYFVKAKDNDLKRAEYALSKMQVLYDLEEEARSEQYTHQQRYELRQQKALSILNELEAWMKEEYSKVTPTSPIGKAINYSLSRWERLKLYATDGQLEIDNNLVENAIRPVALGRKNFLFAGSHNAAQNIALLYSLMITCKLHTINPKEWLTDVIKKLPSYPVKNLENLLPHKWKPGC